MAYVKHVTALVGVRLTPKQWAAVRYLSKHGLQFGVHYGYGNAEAVAKAHRRLHPPQRKPRPARTTGRPGRLITLEG